MRRIIKNRCFFFCLAVFGFLLCGCAGEQFEANTDLQQFQQITQEAEKAKGGNDSVALKPTAASLETIDAGDYILGPGDLLQMTVFETKDLDSMVRISSRGQISLPLLGTVDVKDLTAAEAEAKIEDLLKAGYLQEPHVSLYIKEYVSKQITMVGSFKSPGTFDYVAKKKLLDVVAIAGGVSEKAGSAVYITRFDEKTKKNVTYFVDLDQLFRRGNMEQNIPILGGDVIFVPESGQCFVDGAVRKPGTYPLRSNMTIAEIITLAGGLAGYADNDKIKLIRYMGDGKDRQILSLTYNDLLQGGAGNSLVIKDQDIIFAEASSTGTFLSGSGFTMGFMGTGMSYKDPRQ